MITLYESILQEAETDHSCVQACSELIQKLQISTISVCLLFLHREIFSETCWFKLGSDFSAFTSSNWEHGAHCAKPTRMIPKYSFFLNILTKPKPCNTRSSAFLTLTGTFSRWSFPSLTEGQVRLEARKRNLLSKFIILFT